MSTDIHPQHVICIQDLSCFGKCSLTIALPILNAAGITVSPLPTALLSTHTGGLGKPHIHDLHHDMHEIRNHWNTLKFPITAIYSAYASNDQQFEEIKHIFHQYPKALRFVDPVMGDHGKRYSSLHDDVVTGMKELCMQAHIITPNITEAYMLLDEEYQAPPYSETECKRIAADLHKRYHADIILTGVSLNSSKLGCICLSENNEPYMIMHEYLPYHYHGSGDLFASAFLGAYLKGQTVNDACKCAMYFTTMCLKYSHDMHRDERYGICFEALIKDYINMCHIQK